MRLSRRLLVVAALACVAVLAVALGGPVVALTCIGSIAGAVAVALLQPQISRLRPGLGTEDAAAAEQTHAADEAAAGNEAPADAAPEQAEEPVANEEPTAAETPQAEPTAEAEAPAAEAADKPAVREPARKAAPAPTRVGLDMDMLARALFLSNEPIEVLRLVARDIKTRKTNSSLAPVCGIPRRPTGAELYLMRMLSEAGILEEDLDNLSIRIVRLSTSGLFYVRVQDERLPYPTMLRLLRIEAALNALQMAAGGPGGLDALSLEDAYVLFQRIVGSIEAEPLLAPADEGDGEWAVRHHISRGLEAMRLPFRLRADFRVNLAEGRVAFEADVTPPEAFPSSAAVPGIGIVPATSQMRATAARDYNLRIAHLLASLAFSASPQVTDVWVAGVLDTPLSHECHYSVRFDRARFELLDLASGIDPVASALSFGATLAQKDDGLAPVEQGFSLSDELFCPARRYEAPERSVRALTDEAAKALGTSRVSGLAVDEADRRTQVAEHIMRGACESTSGNVSLILSLVEDDPDPSVRLAAERTVSKLIDGVIEDDPLVIAEEFCEGDALSRAVRRAQDLLADGDPVAAERAITRALGPLEATGAYDDSATVCYRFFGSYPERVLYNRLMAKDGVTTLLVPEAYPWALALRSMAQLMQGRPEEALAGARRCVEVCPLSAHARLHLVQCLDSSGERDEALQALNDLLEIAHDSVGIGFGYYRLAYMLWQQGDTSGAQACYKRAVRFAPVAVIPVPQGFDPANLPNVSDLRSIVIDKRDDKVLMARSIPLAPTGKVRKAFDEAARAALDAEVFPVARSLVQAFAELTRDDVTLGVLRSIEEEPDC